jgi:hypothetical protein
LNEAFDKFQQQFISGTWGLPLPEWQHVLQLALRHVTDPEWTKVDYPDPDVYFTWDVNYHYAKFLTRVMSSLRAPHNSSLLLFWVRDAEIEIGFWVLFHTLMYLQLERMRENERSAPWKSRFLRRLSLARK